MEFDVGEYYRNFVLPHLEQVELDANSELVRLLQDGIPHVYKKDLAEKYGLGKRSAIEITMANPESLDRHRSAKRTEIRRPPLDHDTLSEVSGADMPDWDALLADIDEIASGNDGADDHPKAVEKLLSALCYPSLVDPRIEREIHSGRKRIDIDYTNIAQEGFFAWLAPQYPAPHIFVECKNYSSDPANPALDQFAVRFSPSRGRFGILVSRKIQNKELFALRCRDTARDDRGFIIGAADNDLAALVEAVRGERQSFGWLKQRFDQLVMYIAFVSRRRTHSTP